MSGSVWPSDSFACVAAGTVRAGDSVTQVFNAHQLRMFGNVDWFRSLHKHYFKLTAALLVGLEFLARPCSKLVLQPFLPGVQCVEELQGLSWMQNKPSQWYQPLYKHSLSATRMLWLKTAISKYHMKSKINKAMILLFHNNTMQLQKGNAIAHFKPPALIKDLQ